MALHKISDFDRDYKDTLGGNDIKGMSVYSRTADEKIGSVDDIIVDDSGKFRYFVLDLGFWIFGKKVLLPVGRATVDDRQDRVYVDMTKDQAENLQAYNSDMTMDYDYEEGVRNTYRSRPSSTTTSTTAAMGTGAAATAAAAGAAMPGRVDNTAPKYDRDTYNYDLDADLYDVGARADANQNIKLYEERLIASKQRRKSGEVSIGKHVESHTETISVPVDKERVVVERVTPTDAGRPVAPGEAAFREGEVARVEVYEETPEVRKEAYVREEVRVRKDVTHETVRAEDTVRREELDVDTEGRTKNIRSTDTDINRRDRI
ncbi:MAG: PRC and DUF2382 domain-containing protein [Xenococcaceae cyanobacterium]